MYQDLAYWKRILFRSFHLNEVQWKLWTRMGLLAFLKKSWHLKYFWTSLYYTYITKKPLYKTLLCICYFSIYHRERKQREVMSHLLVQNCIDWKKCLSLILMILSYKTNQFRSKSERNSTWGGRFFFLQVYKVVAT